MAQYSFGAGALFATRTDLTNATPVQFGVLQDVSLDFSYSTKELTGQYQFPVAVARSAAKVSGKAKAAKINANAFNNVFFGQTITPSVSDLVSLNELQSVPSSSAYTVTVANSATFASDLGVVYTNTGLLLTKVASAPAAGQYAVNVATGVYTFSASDSGASVQISYTYTTTSGNKIVMTNQLMGAGPTFKMTLFETYLGKNTTIELNQCLSTKLSFDFKNEDFTVPEFDFSVFTDASNTLGTISTSE